MQVRNFTGEHTVKEIAGFLKMSDRTVREQLQALAEMGAVKQARESRGPIPATWQITADLQLAAGADNPLPSVEEVSGVEGN